MRFVRALKTLFLVKRAQSGICSKISNCSKHIQRARPRQKSRGRAPYKKVFKVLKVFKKLRNWPHNIPLSATAAAEVRI
jgi:hypothetical protein